MSIKIISHLEPANGNDYYLVEDTYTKGGFRVVDLLTDLDRINPKNRKTGMVVQVNENESTWTLEPDLITWKPFSVDVRGSEFKMGMYVYVTPIEGIVEYVFVDDVNFKVNLEGSKASAIKYANDIVAFDLYKNRTEFMGQLIFNTDKTSEFNTNGELWSFNEGDTITIAFQELNGMEGISITFKGFYNDL